jgi:hypothetical protein
MTATQGGADQEGEAMALSGKELGDEERRTPRGTGSGARGSSSRTLSKGKSDSEIGRRRTENQWGDSGLGARVPAKAGL